MDKTYKWAALMAVLTITGVFAMVLVISKSKIIALLCTMMAGFLLQRKFKQCIMFESTLLWATLGALGGFVILISNTNSGGQSFFWVAKMLLALMLFIITIKKSARWGFGKLWATVEYSFVIILMGIINFYFTH